MLTLLPRRRMASRVPSTSSLRRSTLCWCQRRLRPSVLTATGGVCCATIAVIRSVVPLDTTADLVLSGVVGTGPGAGVADDGGVAHRPDVGRRATPSAPQGEFRRVASRSGLRRRRRAPPRAAADEGRRAELPARCDGGLPALHVGAVPWRAAAGSATSVPPRRPAWSARWPTGSRSPRCSSTRWASRSRTPRSSSARRTSSARVSAPSSGRTSCRRRSSRPSCATPRSPAGSASGCRSRRTPRGSPPRRRRCCGCWWRCCATRTCSRCWTG